MPPIEPARVPTPLGEVAVHVLGDGTPTVLWHPLFVDGSSWGYVIPRLLPGRRLFVVDGPGWGRSDRLRAGYREADAVGAAEAVVRALAPGTPVDWLGAGWGGRLGMQLAATRPALIRSLVAISAPTGTVDPELRAQLRRVLPLMLLGPIGPVRDVVLQRLLTDRSRTDPQTVGAVVDALALAGGRGVVRSVRAFLLGRQDIGDLVPRITAPSLFVAGEEDPDWPPVAARRAAAVAPFARAEVVHDSRSLVPLDQPIALATLVREFWSGLESPA